MRSTQEQIAEINFNNYIKVIVQRRALVSSIFFASVIIAAGWSSISPKIYEVSTIIDPPSFGEKDSDSADAIKTKIEEGIFDRQISQNSNLPENALKFKITHLRNTNLLRISLRCQTKDTGLCMQMLTSLATVLSRNYSKTIEDKKNSISNQIKMTMSRINMEEREKRLQQEQSQILSEMQKKFDKLLTQRRNSQELEDDTSSILQTTAVQQNALYLAQLQGRLFFLENDIIERQSQISNLEILSSNLRNILVIQEPLVSQLPVSPNKRRNILTAGIFGLVLGIFAAFVIEFRKPATSLLG